MMPIRVYIHFTKALSNVVVKDLVKPDEFPVGSVLKDDTRGFLFDETNGEATVHVSGVDSHSNFVEGSERRRNEETYDFPPKKRSAIEVEGDCEGLEDEPQETPASAPKEPE